MIETAVAEMRELQAVSALDKPTIAAILEGEAQGERVEGVDLETFRQQFHDRLTQD